MSHNGARGKRLDDTVSKGRDASNSEVIQGKEKAWEVWRGVRERGMERGKGERGREKRREE